MQVNTTLLKKNNTTVFRPGKHKLRQIQCLLRDNSTRITVFHDIRTVFRSGDFTVASNYYG